MDDFGKKIIGWYDLNRRDLPWRNTKDPYKIWLSEIILQQTRIDQGINYYLKFIKRYPTITQLANADQDEVYKLWQGLGYYNRASNMLKTAKIVLSDYGGKLPTNYVELLKLPGIGSYTAAAIGSIAFGINKPVVDGNVFRVLSRLFAIKTPINSTKGKKEFEKLASELMDDNPPGEFNQAMMEFGALYCKPINPGCEKCIFKNKCAAYRGKMVEQFPVKLDRVKIKKRYLYYFVISSINEDEEYYCLNKRNEKDIWKNLYEFPQIEFDSKTEPELATEKLMNNLKIKGNECHIQNISKTYRHQLTHQQINAVFIKLFVNNSDQFAGENSILLINKNSIMNYPVSRLIERYLQDQKMIK